MAKNRKLSALKLHIQQAEWKSMLFPGLFLIMTIVIFQLLPAKWMNEFYHQNFYPIIRFAFNHSINLLPILTILIVLPAILGYLICLLVVGLKSKLFGGTIIRIITTLLYVGIAFFWLWGNHYFLPSEIDAKISPRNKIEAEDVLKTIAKAEKERKQLGVSSDSISHQWQNEIEEKVQKQGLVWISSALESIEIKAKPSAKKVKYWPSGMLMRWGITGNYMPFTGEPAVDRGIHFLRMPTVILHEWAHSMGFTGEGNCNFVAYIAAMHCSVAQVKYAAHLERLRDELYLLAGDDYSAYQNVKEKIPAEIKGDMLSIRVHHRRYRGKLSEAGDFINDQYLKTLGIEDGVDNYLVWVLQLKNLESRTE